MSEPNLRFLGELSPRLLASMMWPADEVAVRALTAIAGDDERLSRFLSLSGLQPDTLRSAARSPAFLLGVLDYVVADEATLVEVAGAMGAPPAVLVRAREALAPRPERDEAAPAPTRKPLTLFCKGCGAKRRLDRGEAAGVPPRVVMIETTACPACGEPGEAGVTWLDAKGNEVPAET